MPNGPYFIKAPTPTRNLSNNRIEERKILPKTRSRSKIKSWYYKFFIREWSLLLITYFFVRDIWPCQTPISLIRIGHYFGTKTHISRNPTDTGWFVTSDCRDITSVIFYTLCFTKLRINWVFVSCFLGLQGVVSCRDYPFVISFSRSNGLFL